MRNEKPQSHNPPPAEWPSAHTIQNRPEPGDAAQRAAREARQHEEGWLSRGYLPHDQDDEEARTQHVTLHLADSLPQSAVTRILSEIAHLPESQRAIEQRKRLHQWIDAGHGSCLLQIPECAAMAQASLLHFAGHRYQAHAWVIMPNHIHVLFTPLGSNTMQSIVTSWKKFIGKRLASWTRKHQQQNSPDTGIWHREYWDRYIRNDEHFANTRWYIENNPVAAGLVDKADAWPWSSAHPGSAGLRTGQSDHCTP